MTIHTQQPTRSTSQQIRSFFLRMLRMLAWLTAVAVATAGTLGALLLWRIAGDEALLAELGVSRTAMLIAYGLMAVCPWWALLTVMFHKLGWLSRPRHGNGAAVEARAHQVHHADRLHPPALMR